MPALEAALREVPQLAAGTRLRGDAELTDLLARAGPQFLAADAIGKGARPVRAVLFNKAPESNWALGWHQDRTICVRARRDVAGFANWTVKQGMLHVEPPFGLLERMATMRVHLDDAGPDNAPLLIAPGSHRLGRLPDAAVAPAVARCGVQRCLAEAGDIWLYSTPILHASAASVKPGRRRVLQVDYAAEPLPDGLEWAGI